MSSDDPIRFSAGGSPEVRALLRSLAADAPTAAEVATLTAALAPVLHVGAAAAATTAAGAGASTAAGAGVATGAGAAVTTVAVIGLKAWLAIAVIGTAAVGGTVAWRQTREPAPRPAIVRSSGAPPVTAPPPSRARPASVESAPPAPAPLVEPSPAVPPTSVAPSEAAVVATTTEVQPPRPSQRTAGSSPRRPPAIAPSTAVPPSPEPSPAPAPAPAPTAAPPAGEIPVSPAPPRKAQPNGADLLLRAGVALRNGDAKQALELTVSQSNQHPNDLVAEREVIAIEALARLGRVDEARARYQQFSSQFPQSYRARLQRLLAAAAPR